MFKKIFFSQATVNKGKEIIFGRLFKLPIQKIDLCHASRFTWK